jgi:putative ABC transport system ATP-binding protein
MLPGLPGTTRISEMSVGQRQRLSIIRALAHRPPLVLCDEPTAALDDETALTLLDLLVSLAREASAGVLVVTHDGELLRSLGFEQHVVRPGTTPDSGNVLELLEILS